jgi:hypothetical protein
VLENHAVYRLRLGDKVNVARITAHWQAPMPDAAICNAQLVKEERDVLVAAVPLAADNDGQPAPDNAKTNKGLEGGKKPDEIPLVRKVKADNRTAWPAC